jgi:uncharacterized protein (TIGR02145 family)
MAKIIAYATVTDSTKIPTVEDYAEAGITGVDADNLNAVNAGVAVANAADVVTVDNIQTIATAGKNKADVAMAKITAYVPDSTNTNNSAPTVDDYKLAGVTGVDAANLNAVNYGLGEKVSTVEQIKAIVDAVVTLSSSITINDSVEGVVLSVSDEAASGHNIHVPGVVDDGVNGTNVVNVSMSYTVTGSITTLPAYSKTFTIDVGHTNDKKASIVVFSWKEQKNLTVGSGTFDATITTTTDSTYNAKKLDIEDDIAGIVVATFSYPTYESDSAGAGKATLRVIPGIPDRMFGVEDGSGDANAHKFVYLPVTNPITGRTWLNNNLGAEYADSINTNSFKPTQQAKSSTDHKAYGSLFQWGRKATGHELIKWKNATEGRGVHSYRQETKNNPTYPDRFLTGSKNWRETQDNTLWEETEVGGASNVCPVGYRLPTGVAGGEWEVEVNSWHTDTKHESTTLTHAYESTLKLSKAGYRQYTNADMAGTGTAYDYWSGSVIADTANKNPGQALGMYIKNEQNIDKLYTSHPDWQGFGLSVRCIKNQN